MTTPLIHTDADTPRARLTDPVQSHIAADVSSYRRRKVLLAVLEILRDEGDDITGSELNELYKSWRAVFKSIPRCHPDSPRKRAGEAAEEALLDVVGHRKSGYGTSEAVYSISVEGRALLDGLGI